MSKSKEQKKSKNNSMYSVRNEKKQNACQTFGHQGAEAVDSNIGTDELIEDSQKSIENNGRDDEIEVSVEKALSVEEKVHALSFLEKIGCMLAKKYVISLKQQIEEIKAEFQEKQSEHENKYDKLVGQIDELKHKNDEQKEEIDRLGEKKRELTVDRERLETEKKSIEAERDDLKNENQVLIDEKNRLVSKNKELESRINDYELQCQNSTRQLKEFKSDSRKLFEKIKSEFKNIITDTMTIEEAIAELSKALITCKEQIESAKKDVKEAEKKNNEMEIKLQGAEQRVKEIEFSDNGKLIQELESTRYNLEEKISLLAQKESEFADFKEKDYCNLKIEKETAEEKIKESQKLLEDEKNAHKESIAKLNKENDRLKEEHKASIIRLKEDYKKSLNDKDNEHSDEVNRIKQDNAEKEKQNEDRHSKEIAEIKETAANKENELTERLRTKENEIESLRTTLQNESDSLRNRTIDVITGLHEFLKSNEIMAACSDDYRDKVEEKLQDLIFNSEVMMNDINRLPQAQTPSEWETTLKSYIVDRIEENTSLINILLKYYTLSNVPFMIDTERDNGLYFIRKNIKCAYDAIVTILKQCNITPILPTLFVENINEGLYEVEGQFNDVESFCPGSINEHIEYIERSEEGLSGIIIGVTRVGYLIDENTCIKAQVLIS